jgi:surfactin synthase thioesterase subunit
VRTHTDVALIRPLPRPAADRVMICFSFCGGGTAPMRAWAGSLPEDVELVLYCYPGREGRFSVPFARDWAELLTDAMTAVRGLTDRRYLLAGHSMGAWMAFEVAARLEQSFLPDPEAVVVSAADAPTRWAAKRHRPPTLSDTDAQLLEWMATVGQLPAVVLEEPDLREIALDIFRADLRVSRSYRYAPGTRLRAPLHILYGRNDNDVDAAAAERWRGVADGPVRIDELPGAHFYTEQIWRSLPSRMAALRPAGAP